LAMHKKRKNFMREIHFNDLSMHDKTLLVTDFATELCSIEFYDHRIYLYSLNSLFIEAYHNIETREIERIAVAKYSDLDKFISRVRLHYYLPSNKIK
jgi:hypothetical protein